MLKLQLRVSYMMSKDSGASLGVIELTIALHYVFNTPHDQEDVSTFSTSFDY